MHFVPAQTLTHSPVHSLPHSLTHSLIQQSYKTLVCFLTCWLIVFLGEEIRWTNWGILSGLFWVPAATCGIYGIRNAGLAIAVGTWSSMNVIMSFIWGALIFQENFRSLTQTAMAFVTLIIGLLGMSTYSSPEASAAGTASSSAAINANGTPSSSTMASSATLLASSSLGLDDPSSLEVALLADEQPEDNIHMSAGAPKRKLLSEVPRTPSSDGALLPMEMMAGPDSSKTGVDKDRIILFGGRLALTRRQLGIIGAVINGTWGGLNLVPLHFAKREGFGGAAYLISFACGSMIVNTVLWICYFLYCLQQKRFRVREALYSLPEWHLEELWLPGFLAGTLYSIGSFGSILAVTYLGQGVGFSLCQVQILVSGLWGIFYYKEIRGRNVITKWLCSACLTVVGILWLSSQHEGDAGGHR